MTRQPALTRRAALCGAGSLALATVSGVAHASVWTPATTKAAVRPHISFDADAPYLDQTAADIVFRPGQPSPGVRSLSQAEFDRLGPWL